MSFHEGAWSSALSVTFSLAAVHREVKLKMFISLFVNDNFSRKDWAD